MTTKKSRSQKSIWFNRKTNFIVGGVAIALSLLIVIPYAQQRQSTNQYADEANQNPVPSPQCAGSPDSVCNPENEAEIDQDNNGGNASQSGNKGKGKAKGKDNKNKPPKGEDGQAEGDGDNASGSGNQGNGNGNGGGNQGGVAQIIEMLKKLLEEIMKLLTGGK